MKVQHPSFPDLVRKVSDEASPRWQAAGWLPVEAELAEPEEVELPNQSPESD